jgi:N-methylhydantoinase A/oxoprolinase/acetone carboxylase beta subunit
MLPPTDEEVAQAAIEKKEEVMGPKLKQLVRKAVTVVGQHHLCGFRGIVQWCNESLHICGVCLEANSQPIIISPRFLIVSAAGAQM